jgi:hypothetical protein
MASSPNLRGDLLKDLADDVNFANALKAKPAAEQAGLVGAWEVFATSSDGVLRAFRTDISTLARFSANFGDNISAINQLKNHPGLLATWQKSGLVLHRHYPGSSSWPIIQVDDTFKANIRATQGDEIGNLVDAVDNLVISNNAAVGAGVYHPSLANPITAVNFLTGEVSGGIAQSFIDNLHPILKARVDYLEFLKINNLLDASAESINTAGKFGSHAEFRVLDKSIKDLEVLEGVPSGAFPESRLEEFTIFVKAKNGPNGLQNTNPPRCVSCWHGTHGVNVVGNE